jgi:TonB family protein
MRKISSLGFLALLASCAAISGARAAEQATCDSKDIPKALRPIMATHTLPPYPEMSVMTNEQGTTLLTVTIGADGVPTDVQIQETSSSIRLDEAARDYVKQNWRWAPFAEGCAAVRTRVSVKWDVRDARRDPPGFLVVRMKPEDFPAGALARHEKGAVAVIVAIQPGGAFADVKLGQGSGFPDLDELSLSYVKVRHWTPGQMDGKPVFTVFPMVLLWGIDDPSAEKPH